MTDDFLDELQQKVYLKRDELKSEIHSLTEQILEKKQNLRQLDAILKASGVQVNSDKPKAKSSGTGKNHAPTVLEFMKENHRDEGYTAKEISDAINMSRSAVSGALGYLRDNEKIRAIRKVQGGGWAYGTWE